jgi:hypothetical protein
MFEWMTTKPSQIKLVAVAVVVVAVMLAAFGAMMTLGQQVYAQNNNQKEPQSSECRQSGNMDWIQICSSLQMALVSSCDVLVNSDNTLTSVWESICFYNSLDSV